MTKSVSVPEKTLEHWSSLYLTYRYRSQVLLWWPTRGEDIDVQMLTTTPGKAVQLELKTTTPAGTGLHDVNVNLGQLWEYSHKPLGMGELTDEQAQPEPGDDAVGVPDDNRQSVFLDARTLFRAG
jgi:hypothetical protein